MSGTEADLGRAAGAPFWSVRRTFWCHLALVLLVSAFYETRFIDQELNHMDEAWPLHAAMRLQAGGTLYHDVFWSFPPGHVLTAWIAYKLDPPGIVTARWLYAFWTVALCGWLLILARRITTPGFALLGVLLLAIAAPRTHLYQAIYGYRYLVLTVLALLCFDQRLRSGQSKWLFPAGVFTGVALAFRLTPAFSVACGVAVGVLAADQSWRRWLREWSLYAAGLCVAIAPVLIWLHWSSGLGRVAYEVVYHPLQMVQGLPWPEVVWPQSGDRKAIWEFFVALEFRLYLVLYVCYFVVLLWQWLRAVSRALPFRNVLLLAVVVWGGVFFIRSFGRSDEPHLDSVIAPICLLLGHALGCLFATLWPKLGCPLAWRAPSALGLGVTVLAAWIYLTGTEYVALYPGKHPVAIRGDTTWLRSPTRARTFNEMFANIESKSLPGDSILDMAAAPIFHVGSNRLGHGYADLIMPGIFVTEDQELAFLERVKANPPALVVWSPYAFDRMPERSVRVTTPHLAAWVEENYEQIGPSRQWVLLVPRQRPRR